MLTRDFFEKDALVLAPQLLGCEFVHKTSDGTTSGIIVETECYSEGDAASHCYKGETPRTKVMFGEGGYAYIYFTYGMHYCFNVVSGPRGSGQAVLLRALEPKTSIEIMEKRRNKNDLKELCNGPAKLVQAMGLSKTDYGRPVFEDSLHILPRKNEVLKIISGPRIGIKKAVDKPWRFWIEDNIFVSR
jgi:DNA-3-methyladenine glycosylase